MSRKNNDHFGLRLEKISESSSPDISKKGVNSPLRTCRARVNLGGFGDTYRSFYKIENDSGTKQEKGVTAKVSPSQTLAQKQKIIQELQQKIMKETVRKNARQKSYNERIKTNWRAKIQKLIIKFMGICMALSKTNKQIRKSVLILLFKCNAKTNRVDRLKVIMHWIACWVRPVFAMVSWVCNKTIS